MGRRGASKLVAVIALGLSVTTGAASAPGAATRDSLYGAVVHASGKLVVTFSGRDVTSGTITWTPPSTGGLELLGGGARWPRGYLYLDGSGSRTTATIQHAGSGTCSDTDSRAEGAEIPVAAAGPKLLRFGLFGSHGFPPSFGPPETPLALAFDYMALGPQSDVPAPTRCGGPLPGDVLRLLPNRIVTLRRLTSGLTSVDLSGTARFSAGGLSGTVTSTLALRVGKLRRASVPLTPPRVRLSEADRALYIRYRIRHVIGSVGLDFTDVAAGCASFDTCGTTGAVHLELGPARGNAEVIAYEPGVMGSTMLRRSVGLAHGRASGVQVYGEGSWSHTGTSVSETVNRGSAVVCTDSARMPVAQFEIDVHGTRATAIFGASGGLQLLPPASDLLRTRCPGPVISDLYQGSLAHESFPSAWLGRRTITLHLTRGGSLNPLGFGPPLAFTWRTHPDVTIVLQRTSVTEKLLPSSDFET